MASRSTEYRKRKGLTQVGLDWDEATWAQATELTGATTKRGAVEELLRRLIERHRREQESKAKCARSRAEALARLGLQDEL